MSAGTYNITIEQGATFRLRVTCNLTDGSPYILTGHTARMQIRTKVSSPTVIYALTTENGGLELTGASGIIDMYIAADDTAAFEFRSAVYDLEVQAQPDGDVVRLLQGRVMISPEVTR